MLRRSLGQAVHMRDQKCLGGTQKDLSTVVLLGKLVVLTETHSRLLFTGTFPPFLLLYIVVLLLRYIYICIYI